MYIEYVLVHIRIGIGDILGIGNLFYKIKELRDTSWSFRGLTRAIVVIELWSSNVLVHTYFIASTKNSWFDNQSQSAVFVFVLRVLCFLGIMQSLSADDDSNTAENVSTMDQRMQEQKKLYFLSENLQTMHAALPMYFTHFVTKRTCFTIINPFRKYQMRIPYELLTELANSLLNGTVFEIVKGLMEIQHVTEKHLQNLRKQVQAEHEGSYGNASYH